RYFDGERIAIMAERELLARCLELKLDLEIVQRTRSVELLVHIGFRVPAPIVLDTAADLEAKTCLRTRRMEHCKAQLFLFVLQSHRPPAPFLPEITPRAAPLAASNTSIAPPPPPPPPSPSAR